MDQPLRVAAVLTRGSEALPVEWVWLPRDPAAVRLCVSGSPWSPPPRPMPSEDNSQQSPPGAAVWCVARSRLRDALAGSHRGRGDVLLRAWPQRRMLGIALRTSDGWWRGVTDSRTAAHFLGESYAHVSSHREAVMVAAAANRLDPHRLAEFEGEAT